MKEMRGMKVTRNRTEVARVEVIATTKVISEIVLAA